MRKTDMAASSDEGEPPFFVFAYKTRNGILEKLRDAPLTGRKLEFRIQVYNLWIE
jgi:hypothetical protein